MLKKDNFIELMDKGWLEHLWPALSSSRMEAVYNQLKLEKSKNYKVFPEYSNTFNCFRLTPWNSVKVVILGQEPYCKEGLDHGLAFSTLSDDIPKILENVLEEVEVDIYDGFNITRVITGDLTSWTSQGVLLMNSALTTKLGWNGSHNHLWEDFTKHVLQELSIWKNGIIYLVMGPKLKKFIPYINEKTNHIIQLDEYSPKGSFCFSKINELLVEMNGINSKIIW